jgi:hypothetical protein
MGGFRAVALTKKPAVPQAVEKKTMKQAAPAEAPLSVYRHDPYNIDTAVCVMKEAPLAAPALPPQTLYTQLADLGVGFMPYPTEEFYCAPAVLPREEMARVFIGQLPYGVTDMQLQWLCYTFGNGTVVHFPERILKKDPMNPNNKLSTGCVHAYCHPDDVEALMAGMHKKILIDDTGVWFAHDQTEQLNALIGFTAEMKKDKTKRPINRPYDTVVVQMATSTYVPRPPCYNVAKKDLPRYF